MKIFDTYEDVGGMSDCMKRPIVVQARQIHEEFRVNTLEGNYKQGKAGDYLMRGVDAELYICDQAIFEKTYDFVTDPAERTRTFAATVTQAFANGADLSGRATP
jgi:hypothetical protein